MPKTVTIWILLTLGFSALATSLHAQHERSFYILASKTTAVLDSLSIIEDSFKIYGPDDKELDPAFYNIDYSSATINLRVPEPLHSDSLKVSYNVFLVNLSEPYFHKDTSWVSLPGPGESFRPLVTRQTTSDKGLLDFPGIHSSGSISRGITAGNRQDLALNSAMNLQLSGNLTDEIEVLAVISDQDIPLQPEGTTQQLQDFDKVFIQLSGYDSRLIAGDFEIERPEGHFMNFSRKSQGGMVSYKKPQNENESESNIDALDISLAGAISKGLYARNVFSGMEGNQGPYRLQGNNAENYIIILAGTERVYIDGVLLVRGMENDYVIDYNQAELTFTAKRLITNNSRITVEFEYAARDYARSMYFTSTGVESKYGSLRVNFFSEQDHPSQPLFKELSEEQRNLLAAVGDSLHKAFTWNFDSVGFKNDRVMYLMTDTLGYDTVFVHSTDPARAHYQVGFTYVGEENGNYRQISSAANGRVFQWVAPANGTPQGTHEPVQQLVPPQKSQMLSIGYDFDISENTNAAIEWAYTNNDLNLFSDLDKENNNGFAILARIQNKRKLHAESNWTLRSEVFHETANRNFRPIERYRTTEFERDWNIGNVNNETMEHHSGISLKLENLKHGQVNYEISSFLQEDLFTGLKNSLNTNLRNEKNRIFYNGSYLNASGWQESDFYRHSAGYTRLFKYLNIGLNHQIENNQILEQSSGLMKPISFAFDETEVFLSNPDNATNHFRLFYKYRRDYLPEEGGFRDESAADEYGASYEYRANPNQRFAASAIYRQVDYNIETAAENKADNSIVGRLEYFSRWADGAITSTMFYEAASGMERKREYIYIEVPAGQGMYVWIDYNENGIMELDEFELAQYPDEANFIRVFVPTDDFIKIYSNVYSHTLNIDPRRYWQNEEGIRQFLSRFSNQTSYSVNKKILDEADFQSFNPFYINISDTLITTLNTSFRNSLFFNRIDPVWGMELSWRDDRNKVLLSNGFETRHNERLTLAGRWNMTRTYSLNIKLESGSRNTGSEFFSSRNFSIKSYEAEPTLNIMLTNRFRIGLFYGYSQKENVYGKSGEYALTHKAGLDSRLNFPGKASLSARIQISHIEFPFDENTPLAFDMLESLKPGTNQVWNVSWQQNLNEYLLLILNYNGRNSPGAPVIHTGNVQVRAFF